jgi:DNA polymerase II small subunit/DNA polymerase delta subunit B
MLAIGHYHKAELLPSYRNIAIVQTGTFQRQTGFMARHGLAAHIGGWIVEVVVGDMHNIIRPEFVAYY